MVETIAKNQPKIQKKSEIYKSSEKPITLPVDVSSISEDLKNLPRWGLWKLELVKDQETKKPRWTKPPYNPKEPKRLASPTDPFTWSDYKTSVSEYDKDRTRFDGLGFLFVESDGLVGIDLDDAIDPDSGNPYPWAQEIIDLMDSYTELSPSGIGLKIFAKAEGLKRGKKIKYHDGEVEIYSDKRYFTVTGQHYSGTPRTVEHRQDEVEKVLQKVLQWKESSSKQDDQAEELQAGLDDYNEIEMISTRRKLMFTSAKKEKIIRLWQGSNEGYESKSDADFAFLNYLAFYFGPDPHLIAKVAKQSERFRPKWDEKRNQTTWLMENINEVLKTRKDEFYSPDYDRSSDSSDSSSSGQAKAKTSPGAQWPDPIPLDSIPDAEEFPIDVFPDPLKRLATEIADSMNCPIDYPAISILVLVGGAIANSRHLQIKFGHCQSPCLWGVYVGRPGDTKTPPLKLLQKPFSKFARSYLEEYKNRRAIWNDENKGNKGSRSPAPKLTRCYVDDITTEGLAMVLEDNSRGVVMIKNEVSALMVSMNQYKGGKGGDQKFYLNLWDHTKIIVDRKGDKDRTGIPISVYNPFTSIIGGIQPDVLGILRGDKKQDDGFIDRFLFSYPKPKPAQGENWMEVSPDVQEQWELIISRLIHLNMEVDELDHERPRLVNLTRSGKESWQRFTDTLANEMNQESFPPHLRGPYSKLKGYCGRLALIIQLMRWACDETHEEDVDGESMGRASELVDYFKSHCQKTYAAMGSCQATTGAQILFRWIRKYDKTAFQKSEAQQANKAHFPKINDIEPALQILEKNYLIRERSLPASRYPGRQPSPYWDVNPLIKTLAEKSDKPDKYVF